MTTLYQCTVCKYVHQDEPEECDGCDRNPGNLYQEFMPKPADPFTDFFIVRAPGKVPRVGVPPRGDAKTAEYLRKWYQANPGASIDVVTVWADGSQQSVEDGIEYLAMLDDDGFVPERPGPRLALQLEKLTTFLTGEDPVDGLYESGAAHWWREQLRMLFERHTFQGLPTAWRTGDDKPKFTIRRDKANKWRGDDQDMTALYEASALMPLAPHEFREAVNELRELALTYGATDQLRDRLSAWLTEYTHLMADQARELEEANAMPGRKRHY